MPLRLVLLRSEIGERRLPVGGIFSYFYFAVTYKLPLEVMSAKVGKGRTQSAVSTYCMLQYSVSVKTWHMVRYSIRSFKWSLFKDANVVSASSVSMIIG